MPDEPCDCSGKSEVWDRDEAEGGTGHGLLTGFQLSATMGHMKPTAEEAKRFSTIVRAIHVTEGQHCTPDWDKCARVSTGRADRGPTWSGIGDPGIRLDHCAFYTHSLWNVSAYVDIPTKGSWWTCRATYWQYDVFMGDADGPWWDVFRQHLPIWEHEITLPENQPGWHARMRQEKWDREQAEWARKRDELVKKAQRSFRA